jgi:hypothetical protein
MRLALFALVCVFVAACVDTTLDTPSNHPANPAAYPALPAKPPPALMAEFDPFVAYEGGAQADAKAAGGHEHAHHPPAPPTTTPAPSPHAGHEHATTSAPATQPAEPAPAGDAVVYTCPMHPEIIRNAPGNCPICGMKLVPKKPSNKTSP